MADEELASQRAGTAAPDRIRIVLADDHRLVRRGLQMVLDAEPDLEVVAQAGDIVAARRCVLEHRPDVLVVDLNMPGPTTLDAIPSLRADAPETQIVVLTMQPEPRYARAARHAGALGYVLKEAADAELVSAVRLAAAGEAFLNRELATRLVVDSTRNSHWD
jgi:two-component system, NarL family, response regulator NreC